MKIERLKKILNPPKDTMSVRLRRRAEGLLSLAVSVTDLFGDTRRPRISTAGNTAHCAYVGVGPDKLELFLAALQEKVSHRNDMESVHINPFTKRAVFRATSMLPEESTLLQIVLEAERAVDAAPRDDVEDWDRLLPDDPSLPLQTAVEAAADASAAVTGLFLKIFPFGSKIPEAVGKNLYTVLFIASHIPAAKTAIENKLGKRRSDFIFHLAYAAALGMSQRPLTSAVSLADKLESLRELRNRYALFSKIKDDILLNDVPFPLTEMPKPRPVPLKKGPIERYEDRAKAVALGAFIFSLITTRNPLRAVPAAFSAMPYPARYGRDFFASETGRIFARRGMLVLRPDALCRLDRIDCLVVPSETISRDQFQIADVFGLNGIDAKVARERAVALFSADHPLRVQRDGDWSIAPLHCGKKTIANNLRDEVAKRESRGALLLSLSEKRLLRAVAEVHISTKSTAAEAVHKASQMGMKLYVATDDTDFSLTHFGRKIDGVVSLGKKLGDEIRSLQRDGLTVCLIGRAPSDGFFASDFGVAVRRSGESSPFAAHVISPDIPRVIDTVLDACAAARLVSKQSSKLALVSASMGTLASSSGLAGTASSRVVAVMSAASLISMINAVARSRSVGKRREGTRNPTPWHAITAEGVLTKLGTLETGLSTSAETRSPEGFDFHKVEDLYRAVAQEMSNPLTPLLALGAGVSAIVGSKADAAIIAGVGLINGIMGGVQRFRAERNISRLIQTAHNQVRVLRDGNTEICPAATLRLGDIIVLSRGDAVPADCRILFAEGLEVDTSTLTGESLPVTKNEAPSFAENVADITSMLFEGNHISAGHARAVVTAVGNDTQMARAGAMSIIDEERGGVEARLKELMNLTGPITIAAGAALIGAGMLRGKRIEDLVNTAVGLAVAAVPEGLPLLATVAQLAAAERLSRRGALVKNPRAIEAVGRIDVLCMDKTGTLTEGRIALAAVFDGEQLEASASLTGRGRMVLEAAVLSAAEEEGISMDPLNAAILRAANKYLEPNDGASGRRISMLPFDSGRGFEAVMVEQNRGARLIVKGAPELLIAQAKSIRIGKKLRFQGTVRKQFETELERLTAEGLRVVAVAEKEIHGDTLASASPRALMEQTEALTLIGLLAFRDPVRKGAADTIGKLARAGVRVLMLTGDHPKTAEAVARETGLLGSGSVLGGEKIAAMSDDALEAAVEETTVFARVSPAQKVRIIRALERKKHIVGMVGDGANDAAAMRAADAGIAVGLDCTEAARASADIVLKEAHIDELFEVVVEGRAMWRSVRNAVSILVGGNLGEIAFTVAAGALTGRPPLSPRQLLVVNFLTDIAPSTAIALRPPSVFDLHALREVGPKAALGSPLNREIASRAVCTSIGAWSAWSIASLTGSRTRANTVALLGLVGSQLGQTLLSGGKNRAVLLTGIGSAALLGAAVQIPGLSQTLGCTPIGPLGWSIALSASAGSTLISPIVDALIQFGADRLGHIPKSSLAKAAADKLLSEVRELIEI